MRTEAEIRRAIEVSRAIIYVAAGSGNVLLAGSQSAVVVALEWTLGGQSAFGDALARAEQEMTSLRVRG